MKTTSILLISIIIFSASVSTNDAEKGCSIISLFDGVGKAESKPAANLEVCKSIKNTCCVADDFTKIKNNYNGPTVTPDEGDLNSSIKKRLSYLDTILTSFLSSTETLKSRAKAVGEGKEPTAPCPHSTKDILNLQIPTNYVNDLKAAATKCWGYYSTFVRGAICGMCDNDYATAFSLATNKIYFNEAQCSGLVTACGSYAKMMADTIYPWFEDIEALSRCEITGKVSTLKPSINMPFR